MWRIARLLLPVLAIVVAACAEPTIEAIEGTSTSSSVTSEPSTSTTSSPSASSTTSTTAPATTTTAEQESGTIDIPLPVGDPLLSGFTYEEFGAEWEGFVSGLIETGTGRFNSDEGRCLVLLGTLTPTVIDDGAVSSSFNTPRMSLIADGALVDDDVNECDVDDIEDAGYGWILNAEVTVGTTYPFYTEFFLPGDPAAEPEVIVLGSPTGSEALFYEPTVLDSIPTP